MRETSYDLVMLYPSGKTDGMSVDQYGFSSVTRFDKNA
jgi:uncharacterized membrane protein